MWKALVSGQFSCNLDVVVFDNDYYGLGMIIQDSFGRCVRVKCLDFIRQLILC